MNDILETVYPLGLKLLFFKKYQPSVVGFLKMYKEI